MYTVALCFLRIILKINMRCTDTIIISIYFSFNFICYSFFIFAKLQKAHLSCPVFPHTASSTSWTSPLEGACSSWRNPTADTKETKRLRRHFSLHNSVEISSNSPHPFSSLLSEQSSSLSHTWLAGMQCPFSHLNSAGGQVGAGVRHMCSSSSDSSPQSLSPSQTKSCDTQRPFWQVNWCCWHAWYVQPCSSLLSPQSLRRSHLILEDRPQKMNLHCQTD